MNSAKKFVLVDPTVYEKQIARNVDKSPIEKKISEMDVVIRSVLDSDEADDIKAAKYAHALNKFRFITRSTQPRSGLKYEDILDSISNNARHKAKRLLDNIKENTELGWNENGELIYRQSVVPNSNIVQLITDILKPKTVDRPVGWKEFAQGLVGIDQIDKDLIPNQSSWKIASNPITAGSRSGTAPAADAAAAAEKTPKRKNKTSKSSSERKKKRPEIFGEWEEY